jgi:two-component system response regulator FlrC
MSEPAILIVEDDAALREAFGEMLDLAGHRVVEAADAETAMALLESEPISLVLSDVQMPGADGHALLRHVRERQPDLPVVLMTAYGTIGRAVTAMRDGACDYLVKPFEAEELIAVVDRLGRPAAANADAPVAVDPGSRATLELARRAAASDVTVLLSGESGTGKEVLARYIHAHSPRAQGPFVAINCAAIPEQMLEAVLFGHEKGAFTGALAANAGKFEQAQGGTLLLDEISEMDLGLQAKLLRVLQEREVERVGGRKVIKLDVRVLATTNRALKEQVAAGRFREDLFYRLNVMPIRILPLRARRGDILPLARQLLAARCAGRRTAPVLTTAAETRLLAYAWPGNVRELDNLVQRTLILATANVIDALDLAFEEMSVPELDISVPELNLSNASSAEDPASQSGLHCELRDQERRLILDALHHTGSRQAAADRLGISPRTLRYKLAKLRDAGVNVNDDPGAQVAS